MLRVRRDETAKIWHSFRKEMFALLWRRRIRCFVLLEIRGVDSGMVCVGEAVSSAAPEHSALSSS